MRLWGSQKGSGGGQKLPATAHLVLPPITQTRTSHPLPLQRPHSSLPLHRLWGASFQTSHELHLLWEELPAQERHPSWLSTAPLFPPLRFSGCLVSVRAPGCLPISTRAPSSGRWARLSPPRSVRAGHRAGHGQRFLKGLSSLVLPPRIAKLIMTLLLS